MADRQRTFTIDRPADEPVKFTLAYQRRVAGDDADEPEWKDEEQEFVLPSRVPGGVIADLFNSGGGVEAILAFLNGVMPPAERERFQVLVHDHDVAVPARTLTEIAYWLVDAYTETEDPTKPRRSGGNGSRKRGGGSKAR